MEQFLTLLESYVSALPKEHHRYLDPMVVKEAPPPSTIGMDRLKKLQSALFCSGNTMSIPDMTTHHFADGIYMRQWSQAAGVVVVSKVHKRENFFVLLCGECLVSSGETTQRLVAPYIAKTMPGVKRAVFAVSDCTIVTFHPNPTNERDLEALEEMFIIPEEEIPQ